MNRLDEIKARLSAGYYEGENAPTDLAYLLAEVERLTAESTDNAAGATRAILRAENAEKERDEARAERDVALAMVEAIRGVDRRYGDAGGDMSGHEAWCGVREILFAHAAKAKGGAR